LTRSARFALNTSTTPENGSSPSTSAANAATHASGALLP
jgi:hypothetical protein